MLASTENINAAPDDKLAVPTRECGSAASSDLFFCTLPGFEELFGADSAEFLEIIAPRSLHNGLPESVMLTRGRIGHQSADTAAAAHYRLLE